jgi:AraC-like DNA-binding protein
MGLSFKSVIKNITAYENFFANRAFKFRDQLRIIWILAIAIWGADLANLTLKGGQKLLAVDLTVIDGVVAMVRIVSFLWLGHLASVFSGHISASDTEGEVKAEDIQRTQSAPLDKKYAAEIIVRVHEIMSVKEPFLDPLFNLDTLARFVNVRPALLSQVLNSDLGDGFFSLVNRYRIAAAKKIIVHDPEKTITEVAFEVGYNSRSTFYTAFRDFVECTPSEYRRRMKRNSGECRETRFGDSSAA